MRKVLVLEDEENIRSFVVINLKRAGYEAIEAETGVAPAWGRASTDCNIPLSMGIPAVCCGLCRGGGAHTLQEWIDIASVPAGARAALRILEGRLH